MAANCVFQRQIPAAPALNSYSIRPSNARGLNQHSAWFNFVVEPPWTFGDCPYRVRWHRPMCRRHQTESMSAFGTKRTSGRAQSMSAFGGKADITRTLRNVRFWHKEDINEFGSDFELDVFALLGKLTRMPAESLRIGNCG